MSAPNPQVRPDFGTVPSVHLQAGRDKRFVQGCPWVYSNEVRMDQAAKAIVPGSVVELHRVDGKPLAVGTFNPHTLIAFRRFGPPGAALDAGFVRARLKAALALRSRLIEEPYYRLIHAEGDGLPGLIADRYGDTVVLQVGTAGMEALLPGVLAGLEEAIGPKTVVLRNDSQARSLEGLDVYARVAKGDLAGPIAVREYGLSFLADPLGGQKTGWFFDQRRNRRDVAALCRGARVLDLYTHTGGFAVAAAAAGATEVTAIDRSRPALDLAAQAGALNRVAERVRFESEDVFAALDAFAAESRQFDVVVADPPAFVKSRKDLASGAKGYRKLARLAAAVVAPGGFLFAASCSHNMPLDLFSAEVAKGISLAGRTGRILRTSGADVDHPVHPHLPETQYLKALTLQLD